MSLAELYNEFLRNPTTSQLAAGCLLSYITSGVSYSTADDIVRHILTDQRELSKKTEIIDTHEATDSLVLEEDCTIVFVRGSGALLPDISCNLIMDEKIRLLMTTVVRFEHHRIVSMKYMWDQATVLRQLSIIGTRGNMWPIVDGKDQIRMARAWRSTSSDKSAIKVRNTSGTENTSRSPFKSWPDHVNLFQGSSALLDDHPVPAKALVPPRQSAKPEPRNLYDLVGSNYPENDKSGRENEAPEIEVSRESVDRKESTKRNHQQPTINLFGDSDETYQPYTRLIGGGGGGYGDSKKGLKGNFSVFG